MNRSILFMFSPRTWFFIGLVGCIFLLAMAAYFQIAKELTPCPLCISQRIAVFVTGLVFLSAIIHNPQGKGIKIYAIIGTLTAFCGAAISGRHVWIQHLPAEKVPECGPGLEYVMRNFPLSETIKLMLSGTGDCAKVDWKLMGFSMAEWVLLAFLMLAALCVFQILNLKHRSKSLS